MKQSILLTRKSCKLHNNFKIYFSSELILIRMKFWNMKFIAGTSAWLQKECFPMPQKVASISSHVEFIGSFCTIPERKRQRKFRLRRLCHCYTFHSLAGLSRNCNQQQSRITLPGFKHRTSEATLSINPVCRLLQHERIFYSSI